MRVLVACEFSGVVRDAFLRKGHDAWSCDILPSESNFSNNHIQGDVLEILDQKWDMMIAHPPCTAICVTGNRTYANTQARWDGIKFVKKLWDSPIHKIAIENPVGVLTSQGGLPKPQYIHPWMFGDNVPKKTGLWLKNLPSLAPVVTNQPTLEYHTHKSGNRMSRWYYETSLLPVSERSRVRSITFQGIANAMAEQWG